MTSLQEGQVIRRLGAQEAGWHALFCREDGASLLQYSLVVDTQQKLQQQQLQTALEALQRQIPVLRTRVEERDDGPYLVAAPCPSVQLTVLPPGGDWLKQHHRLLNDQKIDPAVGPLWTASLLHEPTNIAAPVAPSHRAVLYLSLCHTITDGLSNAMLCGRLLGNLDRLLRGMEVEVGEPEPIYPSVEELLGGQLAGWSWPLVWLLARDLLTRLLFGGRPRLLDKHVRSFDASRPKGFYGTGTVAVTVPAAEIGRLRALCRAHGVSLNAALSAAVSFAGARMAAGAGDVPARLPTLWLVNARRYLPGTETMHLSTVAGVELAVRIEHADVSEFWSVAEALGRELRWKLNNAREPLLRMRAGHWLSGPGRGGLAGAELSGCLYSINNLGPLDRLLPPTSAVRAVELHRTVKAPPALTDSFCSHCFQTVAGKLCYDLNYVRGRVSEADAVRFSEMVVEVLTEVASPCGEETDAE